MSLEYAQAQIGPRELDAFRDVVERMRRGEIVHDKDASGLMPNGFSMAVWRKETDAGFTACFIVWAQKLSGVFGGIDEYSNPGTLPAQLRELVYPRGVDLRVIDIADMIEAATCYLDGGNVAAKWKEIAAAKA